MSADVSARQLMAYRRAARRPGIRGLVQRVLGDVDRLAMLPDDRTSRGAALAVAHGALLLAVAVPADEEERVLQRNTLLGTVLPALSAAGHDHVAVLIDAALACGIAPSAMLKGSYARH